MYPSRKVTGTVGRDRPRSRSARTKSGRTWDVLLYGFRREPNHALLLVSDEATKYGLGIDQRVFLPENDREIRVDIWENALPARWSRRLSQTVSGPQSGWGAQGGLSAICTEPLELSGGTLKGSGTSDGSTGNPGEESGAHYLTRSTHNSFQGLPPSSVGGPDFFVRGGGGRAFGMTSEPGMAFSTSGVLPNAHEPGTST